MRDKDITDMDNPSYQPKNWHYTGDHAIHCESYEVTELFLPRKIAFAMYQIAFSKNVEERVNLYRSLTMQVDNIESRPDAGGFVSQVSFYASDMHRVLRCRRSLTHEFAGKKAGGSVLTWITNPNTGSKRQLFVNNPGNVIKFESVIPGQKSLIPAGVYHTESGRMTWNASSLDQNVVFNLRYMPPDISDYWHISVNNDPMQPMLMNGSHDGWDLDYILMPMVDNTVGL